MLKTSIGCTLGLMSNNISFTWNAVSIFQRTFCSRPIRPPSSFLLFLNEKPKPEGVARSEFVKTQSEVWRGMSDENKKRYVSKSQSLLEQYKIDNKKFLSMVSDFDKDMKKTDMKSSRINKEKRKQTKIEKEFGKPKRPMNAYSIYLKQQYQNYYIKSHDDVKKAISQIAADWNLLSETLKERYKQRAHKHKEQYDDDLRTYVQRLKEAGRDDLIPKTMKKKI